MARRPQDPYSLLLQAFQLTVMLLTAWGLFTRLDSMGKRIDDLVWKVGQIAGRVEGR